MEQTQRRRFRVLGQCLDQGKESKSIADLGEGPESSLAAYRAEMNKDCGDDESQRLSTSCTETVSDVCSSVVED